MKKITFFAVCIILSLANIILLAFVLSNIVSQPTTMYISNPIYKDCIIPTILFSAFAFMWLLAAKNTDNIIK